MKSKQARRNLEKNLERNPSIKKKPTLGGTNDNWRKKYALESLSLKNRNIIHMSLDNRNEYSLSSLKEMSLPQTLDL